LELAWFAGPEITRAVQGGPISRPANGRLIISGKHAVTAVDPYNGTEFWTRDLPYLLRTGVALPRMSGPKQISSLSHVSADDDYVYIRFGEVCHRLDAYTGDYRGVFGAVKTPQRISLKQAHTAPLIFQRGKGHRGKAVQRIPVGETLDDDDGDTITLTEPKFKGTPATVTLQQVDDGIHIALRVTAKEITPTDYWELFVDTRPLNTRHHFYSKGAFHVLIHPVEKRVSPGLGPDHPTFDATFTDGGKQVELRLTTVDMLRLSGRKAIDDFAFSAAFNQKLRVGIGRWEAYTDPYVYAFNAGWPEFVLSDSIDPVDARPGIGKLSDLPDVAHRWGRLPPHTESAPAPSYAEPHSGDKIRGALEFQKDGVYGEVSPTRRHPLLGVETERSFWRGKGCGGRIGSDTMQFLRYATMAFYDYADDSGVRFFGGVRTGCYVSMVPAHGMLVSVESSNRCRCTYNYRSSLALMPARRRRHEDWAVFSDSAKGISFVNGASVNLAAPGDRRDANGVLWLQHPRARGPVAVKVPLKIQPHKTLQTYRINVDRTPIAGTERPWIYGSGYKGTISAKLDLITGKPEPGTFTALETHHVPALDGQLEDECWKGFNLREGRSSGSLIRYDKTNLYVAIWRRQIVDTRGRIHPWVTKTKGKDAHVWTDTSAAVFLQTRGNAKNPKCLHLAVSASGATFDGLWDKEARKIAGNQTGPKLGSLEDSLNDLGDDEDIEVLDKDFLFEKAAEWNGTWRGKGVINGKMFRAEFAIPWTALADAGIDRRDLMIRPVYKGVLTGSMPEIINTVLNQERYVRLLFPNMKMDPRPYTVRMHFAELDKVNTGDRRFHIDIQGKRVLSDFDVMKAAGKRHYAVIREFQVDASRYLTFALTPADADSPRSPIISGIEVLSRK
jgi:hypothetical protein